MNTESASYVPKYHVLVVENDKDWLATLEESSAIELPAEHFCVVFAKSYEEAKQHLASQHFHFVSIDQRLPLVDGESDKSDLGVDLCSIVEGCYPFTMKVLYTGFGEIHLAARAMKNVGTEYWRKSGTGKDDNDQKIFSAFGWAKSIRHILETRYTYYALQRASDYLPPGLSERGRRVLSNSIAGTLAPKEGRLDEFIRQIYQLWDAALDLTWAQSAAIARHAGLSPSVKIPTKAIEKERYLSRAWNNLADKGWMRPWEAYIGGIEGRDFLKGASEPLRTFRNVAAHRFSDDSPLEDVGSLYSPLRLLLNALALWGSRALMTNVHYHERQRDYLVVDLLRGYTTPWPDTKIRAPNIINEIPGSRSDVFVKWETPDGKETLINLSPFLCLDLDPSTKHQSLWIPSRAARAGGQGWQRRSMQDGQFYDWEPSDEQIAIFKKLRKKRTGTVQKSSRMVGRNECGDVSQPKATREKPSTEASPPTRNAKVFFSYSHEDARLKDDLVKHLALLEREGVIESWHDRMITGGEEWKGVISEHLENSDIILLLISASFLASEYIMDVEVSRAMQRHEDGEVRAVPIILRPVEWQSGHFEKLQALPTDGKPVTKWPNKDEAFAAVAKGIRDIIESDLGK